MKITACPVPAILSFLLAFCLSGPLNAGPGPAQDVPGVYRCPGTCRPPACVCPSPDPPGGLRPEETPQFILLTFDDAVYDEVYRLMEKVLGHRNPDGTPLRATFFVTTDYSDYWLIQRLHAEGHEIADHTMTHTTGLNTGRRVWETEIGGAREILGRLALIPKDEISGFRAPYLYHNEASFDTIYALGFRYDASVVEDPGTVSKDDSSFIWPYTLDYGIAQTCKVQKCTRKGYPGLFEIPLWAMGGRDAMRPAGTDRSTLFKALQDKILAREKGNRAPFGLFLHAFWLTEAKERVDALNDFLDWASKRPEVRFITMSQLVSFMQHPVPLSQLGDQASMRQAKGKTGPEICDGFDNNGDGRIDEDLVHECHYEGRSFRTCAECPAVWPTEQPPSGRR